MTSHVVRRSVRLSLSSQAAISPTASKRRKLSVSSLSSTDSSASSPAQEYEQQVESVKREASACTKGRKNKLVEEPIPADYKRAANEWKFGAHVSAAGGVENAVVNAAEIGANAFALFLKSQRKWSSPDLSEVSINLFGSRLKAFGYDPFHVIPHGSYLINLGNPDSEKRRKSFDCFLDDLRRCELLGLRLYNFHPGSTVGQASKDESISLIAECINKAHKETTSVITVIENMAGAGNVIGSKFAEVASIIEQVEDKTRVGVCFDTCHAFAAGYDLRTREGYETTFAEFDSVIGMKYLRAMHLNDSKMPFGTNKDRHENIGLGHLTFSAFAFLARDARLKHIPLILETPLSSSSDLKGENLAIWRAEINTLNQLSSMDDDFQVSNSPSAKENNRKCESAPAWMEMTRTVEEIVGRKAVINGGGIKEASKKVGEKNRKKHRKPLKVEVEDEEDSMYSH